jgi:uncharacterized membrane protein YfcA
MGLGTLEISALLAAALLVGFSKTAISGVSAISVALFAAVLPARESTGALLPLLLVGDVVAVRAYRRHTDWPTLLRLFPSVAVGVLVGAAFVARVDDIVMRRTIGGFLLAMAAYHVWQRRGGTQSGAQSGTRSGAQSGAPDGGPVAGSRRAHHGRALVFGLLAGFTTMVANAGGPAMSLYLLSSGYTMLGFLGTGAWFFLIVNLFKLPFSAALGLIDGESLVRDALLAVAVLAGAYLGRAVVHRINQGLFERLVLLFTVLASVNLLR